MIRFGVRCRRSAATVVLLFAMASAALGGMPASLESEYRRLEEIQRRIEAFPVHQQAELLKRQIRELQIRLERLAGNNPQRITAERQDIVNQINVLERELGTAQKAIISFREAISREHGRQVFPYVRNRIAAFTFDDPHGTGLGDAVSFLLSKKLLFSARVSSFAIVNYTQGVDHDPSSKLAYFDRVDALTQDQNFVLALWGRLSRTEQGVRIDTFLQIPGGTERDAYLRRVSLPEAMGRGTLTARLKPDRILLQSFEVDAAGVAHLLRVAEQVSTLRASPVVSGQVTGQLSDGGYGRGPVHTIIGAQGHWVELRLTDGSRGWTSVDQFCTEQCRPLIDAANFANDIIAILNGETGRSSPQTLTREAQVMSRQLTALLALPANPIRARESARSTPERDREAGPARAGFANLIVLARLTEELGRAHQREPNFDRIRLSASTIEQSVEVLVDASIADPGDLDLVENLAVLFAFLGDDRRRNLALEIASTLKARPR